MIKTRDGKIIKTNEGQNKLLKRLYGTAAGRFALKVLTKPALSGAAGAFLDTSLSKPFIKPFIRKSGIDMTEYIDEKYRSYNAFFTRRIKPEKRPVDMEPSHFISPCDSKLTVYKIGKRSVFRIKDSYYSVSDLLKNNFLAKRFEGGLCMIFRLEVNDYHRYCYIDDGIKTGNVRIDGELHTVNPIALKKYNIYKRNTREYTIMHTENFGDCVQIEVGAMLVGRIVNHHGQCVTIRGCEKGMFQFGGSTIVILTEKDSVVIDSDILRNSREGIETVVKFGEKIGKSKT